MIFDESINPTEAKKVIGKSTCPTIGKILNLYSLQQKESALAGVGMELAFLETMTPSMVVCVYNNEAFHLFHITYIKMCVGFVMLIMIGIPILIIEKTVGNEIFYYEIQVLLSHSE